MTPKLLVCFAHGKESGPWGTKITYLAEVARQRGFDVMSPDYSHTMDPRQRVADLLALAPQADTLVLAGSSMGGYVSAQACAALRPAALFLMAPALYFPGFDEEPQQVPALCEVCTAGTTTSCQSSAHCASPNATVRHYTCSPRITRSTTDCRNWARYSAPCSIAP